MFSFSVTGAPKKDVYTGKSALMGIRPAKTSGYSWKQSQVLPLPIEKPVA